MGAYGLFTYILPVVSFALPCLSHCCDMCNIMLYSTALYGHQTVLIDVTHCHGALYYAPLYNVTKRYIIHQSKAQCSCALLVNTRVYSCSFVLFTHMHHHHYSDVMLGAMASPITSLTIDYSTVYSGADQRKYQSSASLAFVRGIHWWPVDSPHKGPATRKMFLFDDVIIWSFALFAQTLRNFVLFTNIQRHIALCYSTIYNTI